MAKKKKKKLHPTSKAAEKIKADIAEEILALEAIYADDFSLHNDGIGFQLLVVPHPGLGDNYCSVELHVRYAERGDRLSATDFVLPAHVSTVVLAMCAGTLLDTRPPRCS